MVDLFCEGFAIPEKGFAKWFDEYLRAGAARSLLNIVSRIGPISKGFVLSCCLSVSLSQRRGRNMGGKQPQFSCAAFDTMGGKGPLAAVFTKVCFAKSAQLFTAPVLPTLISLVQKGA